MPEPRGDTHGNGIEFMTRAATGDACQACALPADRREFLRHLAAMSLGALVAAGMPGELAASIAPVSLVPAGRHGGNPTYPVPSADGVQIDTDNQVILVRWKNHVYAFNLSCPHQNAALRWREGAAQFECPKHHSRYQPDGTFISGRATRAMDRFSLARSGNEITVDVAAMHKNDADPAAWSASVIDLSTAG
jgi:Rieske Fe-S protein